MTSEQMSLDTSREIVSCAEFPSSANMEDRCFRALFGTSPSVCAALWDRCVEVDEPGVSEGAVPCHLLWALALLKQYSGDDMLSVLVGESTQRPEVVVDVC